ncbi:MAG: HPF/RaiA family ribosome-associated protein, partial [Propionicimonas sp.]
MDVLVTGRHCQITDDFRTRVEEKIASIEKLKDRVIRVEVQVSAYGYKRQPDQATRVE